LKIEEELDSKNRSDPGPYRVAYSITTGRGNTEKEWILNDLRSEQLRDLATNFGCRKCGSATKFECRKAMALRIDMGEMYDTFDAPDPNATDEELKTNTMIRIINATFLLENVTL
jgi:hypothetical protein